MWWTWFFTSPSINPVSIWRRNICARKIGYVLCIKGCGASWIELAIITGQDGGIGKSRPLLSRVKKPGQKPMYDEFGIAAAIVPFRQVCSYKPWKKGSFEVLSRQIIVGTWSWGPTLAPYLILLIVELTVPMLVLVLKRASKPCLEFVPLVISSRRSLLLFQTWGRKLCNCLDSG